MSHKWNAREKGESLKIPSTEYRKKIIRQRGGFDDGGFGKEDMKKLSKVHKCFWCKKYMKPTMLNHRTGEILMSCGTSGCIGNVDTPEVKRQKMLEKSGARRVDAKLLTDFKQILFGRDPSRMGAIRDRIW